MLTDLSKYVLVAELTRAMGVKSTAIYSWKNKGEIIKIGGGKLH